jgi:hypothetical protein
MWSKLISLLKWKFIAAPAAKKIGQVTLRRVSLPNSLPELEAQSCRIVAIFGRMSEK